MGCQFSALFILLTSRAFDDLCVKCKDWPTLLLDTDICAEFRIFLPGDLLRGEKAKGLHVAQLLLFSVGINVRLWYIYIAKICYRWLVLAFELSKFWQKPLLDYNVSDSLLVLLYKEWFWTFFFRGFKKISSENQSLNRRYFYKRHLYELWWWIYFIALRLNIL